MSAKSRRWAILHDAIGVVMRDLSAMPASSRVEELRVKAADAVRALEGWASSPPTMEERQRLMNRVLRLHREVAELAREPSAR